MKKVGLIGGISWVSTLEYYRGIHECVSARRGDGELPACLVYSLNFGAIRVLFARNDWDGLGQVILSAGQELEGIGVDAIAICSNTSHIVAGRVQEALHVPLLDIRVATTNALRNAKVERVAICGTRLTMEKGFFIEHLEGQGIDCMLPDAGQREYLDSTIFEQLTRGVFLEETRQGYASLIRSLAFQGAQGVALACTEIPLLVKQSDSPVPLFDTTAIHVDAIVDFILS
jgi:aspartate racemase